MYYKSIKIRKADILFSKFIRLRDGECMFKQKCQAFRGRDHWNFEELQCCHFHSRGKESVRFDEQNCDSGCGKCHHWIDQTEEGKRWFKEFKLRQLGQRDLDLLTLRSNTPSKRDDVMTVLYVKELLKELEALTPLL